MKDFFIRSSLLVFAVCSLLLGCSGVASAHVLQENNGVSAVLHIPPDDNPVAAQVTALDFSYNSDSGKFSLVDCNCQVKVKSNNAIIQTVPIERLSGGGVLDAQAKVRFPVIGVYDVIVSGTSRSNAFAPFKLDYLERVASSAASTDPSNSNSAETVLLLSAGSFALLIMCACAAVSHGGRYKTKLIKNT